MDTHNRQWLLQERPLGMVGPEHFELVETALPEPDLNAGQVLVKTLMLGFDPAMRGWLADEPSYLPPVAIGEPMRASGVGQVVSDHQLSPANLRPGDCVVVSGPIAISHAETPSGS